MSMKKLVPLVAMLAAPATLAAQEATNTPAATQPAQGNFYLRQKFQYIALGDDPSPEGRDVDKFVATTSLSYGLQRNVALTLDIPLAYMSEEGASGDDRALGFNDLALTLKYRPVQIDLNPIDSVRFAVLAGVEIPSGFSEDLSSHSWDPYVGGIFTAILGRHGVNQALTYKFNTGGDEFNTRAGDGPDDALRYDTSYLFRLSPVAYAPDTAAATYLTIELNGLYETNGDNEVMLGPGILYEARTFALEASVGLPVVSDVEHRPETDLVVTLGFRVLF